MDKCFYDWKELMVILFFAIAGAALLWMFWPTRPKYRIEYHPEYKYPYLPAFHSAGGFYISFGACATEEEARNKIELHKQRKTIQV